jgi:hypothetical protein
VFQRPGVPQGHAALLLVSEGARERERERERAREGERASERERERASERGRKSERARKGRQVWPRTHGVPPTQAELV